MEELKGHALDRVFAHTREGEPESTWELLREHLDRVATLAEQFAGAFQSREWARLAGLWHDLGKYRPEFQRRLRGSGEQVEHAGVGAALAASKGPLGMPLAFAIAGHHGGLANSQAQDTTKQRPLKARVDENQPVLQELLCQIEADLTGPGLPGLPPFLASKPGASSSAREAYSRRLEFWIRFLFSALVDADRLATEGFYDPKRREEAGQFDSIATLRVMLDNHLRLFSPTTPVNRLRAQVLEECQQAAGLPPGVFSLTVPTGGGKTLSAMAFALLHAERHGLRRVIVVIPYTSIIEQNAEVYRDALGARNVIEHHASVDEAKQLEVNRQNEIRRRLASENWDAPVVVTTNVQFFESLFSNRPSRCRKLHNIARSVVVLDEAQTLPTGYLSCLLDAMRELTGPYGCSLVISTATQPALNRRDSLPGGLEGVREIIGDPVALANALRRVEIRWPKSEDLSLSYEELAVEVARHERVLVIVHLRKDARVLAGLLPAEHRFHLSALMCPAHRSETIERIKAALRARRACRVVATQLIETGVDLDFPVVYRALAGLDSLAQAAGRCNREGEMDTGLFHVFRAETRPPVGTLRIGLGSTESLLKRHGDGLDFASAAFFDEYFRTLYSKSEPDRNGVQPERQQLNFASVAQKFQLIEDGFTHPIIVPWADSTDRVADYSSWPSRETLRALQPYVVNIPQYELNKLQSLGAVELINDSAYVLAAPYLDMYDGEFGLVIDESAKADPEALVV